jgi:3-methyladenine DNA glycosylase AlkD
MARRVSQIEQQLRSIGSAARARQSLRFFRTAPGEYGEGDRFLGLSVPQVRALASQHADLPLPQVRALLKSPWHESRLLALMILVDDFRQGDVRQRSRVAKLYLDNLQWVNNWDLVDSSAHLILGPHLPRGSRQLLDTLSRSSSLWERRIAMLATLHYIRQHEFGDALRIARRLLRDEHDLIHKAVGWMLREIGKMDEARLRGFLDRHAARMPRTMLRYAIERLPPGSRSRYMQLKTQRLPKS